MRGDLPPGLQASQAVHVAHAFAVAYAERFERWYRDSNTVVIVTADAAALEALLARTHAQAVPCATFVDDDLGEHVTAIALGPGNVARKLCCGLPLAFPSAPAREVAA